MFEETEKITPENMGKSRGKKELSWRFWNNITWSLLGSCKKHKKIKWFLHRKIRLNGNFKTFLTEVACSMFLAWSGSTDQSFENWSVRRQYFRQLGLFCLFVNTCFESRTKIPEHTEMALVAWFFFLYY